MRSEDCSAPVAGDCPDPLHFGGRGVQRSDHPGSDLLHLDIFVTIAYDGAVGTPSRSAIRTSSGRDPACIFRMTCPR
jgi:hypothetical protein